MDTAHVQVSTRNGFYIFRCVCVYLIQKLLFCCPTDRHKLQEHSARVQEASWQGVYGSLRAAPQKQFGLWYCTNAHRNNWHQGEEIDGHLQLNYGIRKNTHGKDNTTNTHRIIQLIHIYIRCCFLQWPTILFFHNLLGMEALKLLVCFFFFVWL